MPRYTRLLESDLDTNDFYEVADHFLQDRTPAELLDIAAAEAERAQQKTIRDHIYCVPSTEILSPSKLQCSKGYSQNYRVQRHGPQQQQQNIENGNPNVCPPRVETKATVCSHGSTASGASLQEQGGVRVGASVSGRWTGRSTEDRSGRWKAGGCESFRRDEATSALGASDDGVVPSMSGQCASMQRAASYRETTLQPQVPCGEGGSIKTHTTTHLQPCTLHSSCSDVRQAQRYTKNPLFEEKNSVTPVVGPERKSLSATTQSIPDGEYGGCFNQERSAAVQRSYSTRELKPRPEMSIDNWKNHPAAKSARQFGSNTGMEGRHRVSFSLLETHDLDPQKQREKWREPIPHSRKVWSARNHSDHSQGLRYNYEQPGFVEREKDVSGKPYTIYGVHASKECSRGSSGRHVKLARAFSLREQTSNYSRISRAFSVNGAGRSNVLPVECVGCGEGLGIVILGFHRNDGGLCQSCKPSARGGLKCPDGSKPSKKKGIMEYCRKLLRLPKKVK